MKTSRVDYTLLSAAYVHIYIVCLAQPEPGFHTARGYTNVARSERATPAGRLRIGSTLGLYTTTFLLIDQ